MAFRANGTWEAIRDFPPGTLPLSQECSIATSAASVMTLRWWSFENHPLDSLAMKTSILKVEIRHERDVVLSRQRARQIADLLGFNPQDQVRIATAVSEIARNTFRYAGRGQAEFLIETEPNP